jgi:drug/metabolite transporter (DMT)-like permease
MPADAAGRRRRLAGLLLWVVPAFWATNYLVARAAVDVVHPHLLALLRWTIAGALMLPFAWADLRAHWPAWRAEWRDLLVLGALGMWICGAFVYVGAHTTSATNIGLIYAISPVLIAAISALLFGERLSAWQLLGVSTALAGMVLTLARGSLDALLSVAFTRGDLWIVAAMLSWTAYSLLLVRRRSVLPPAARLVAITGAGVLVLLPFAAIEAAVLGVPRFDATVLGLGLVAAVLPGVGAYQAYAFMQRELGAARTGLVLYLGPPYAALIGWLFLGERLQPFHLAGAALILPGIWLATRVGRR